MQRYTLVRSFGLPFLPADDRPVQVSGLSVDADANTGMLAASPSLPASYTVIVPGAAGHAGPGQARRRRSPPVAGVPGGDSPAYTTLPAGSDEGHRRRGALFGQP